MIIFYNSFIDYEILFSLLNCDEIKKNVILAIYNLLTKDIIRIKGYGSFLTLQIDDEEIGDIIKRILKAVSSNSNIISVIFFESFVEPKVQNDKMRYLATFIPASLKGPLFLKCNKRTDVDFNRTKIIFDEFGFDEKFVTNNRHVLSDELLKQAKTSE